MNADTTVLRIFDDHFTELFSRTKTAASKKALADFSKEFANARNEIDELKHEMHLIKMKLSANFRLSDAGRNESAENNHPALQKRYQAFRKKFDKLKKEFVDFAPEE